MKSLTNVVTFYMKLTSILICFMIFTSQIYLIFSNEAYEFEENESESCIESIFMNIIPIVLKCSFAFLTGGIISNWKYLLVGIM